MLEKTSFFYYVDLAFYKTIQKGTSMKQILLCLLLPAIAFANTGKSTYDQIRDQLENEADTHAQAAQYSFHNQYGPLILKLGFASFATGTFLPLTYQAIKSNNTGLACLYSALTTFFGSYTVLKHAELAENRRVMHEEMFIADQVFQTKMGHLHTRHYMNDIAQFMMAGIEQLAEKYCACKPASVEKESNDVMPIE